MTSLNKRVTGVILVAGNSTRFGKNTNKNFEKINGKSVLSYSLKVFDENDNIDDIIIAIREDEKEIVSKIIDDEGITKKIVLVKGGKSRQESAYNCLKSTESEIVIIHDGARPLIKQEYINECIECMNDYYGSAVGVKAKDTIKITDSNNVVVETTKRDNTWLSQTPQCFDRNVLLHEHENHKDELVTDDCMLLEKAGYKIKIVEGDYSNIKITTFEDLQIAKVLINQDI